MKFPASNQLTFQASSIILSTLLLLLSRGNSRHAIYGGSRRRNKLILNFFENCSNRQIVAHEGRKFWHLEHITFMCQGGWQNSRRLQSWLCACIGLYCGWRDHKEKAYLHIFSCCICTPESKYNPHLNLIITATCVFCYKQDMQSHSGPLAGTEFWWHLP